MPITTIFFDVGGTLIHPDLNQLMAPLLARVQPTAEQLALADHAAKCSYHPNGGDSPQPPEVAGGINQGHWYVYFETLLDAIGGCRDLLPELVARAGDSSYWTEVDPTASPTLARLRRDYRLAVISNADGRILEVLRRAGVAEYFERIIDSGQVGYEKPDRRIFQAALEAMGAAAGESLYVGDIYAVDYRGATSAGMAAVLMDPMGVYREWQVPRVESLAELVDFAKEKL